MVPPTSPLELYPIGQSGVALGGTISDSTETDIVSETQPNESDDPKTLLKDLKSKHRDRPIIAQLNINFLYPKFHPLIDIVKESVDILVVTETKLEKTFTTTQK